LLKKSSQPYKKVT